MRSGPENLMPNLVKIAQGDWSLTGKYFTKNSKFCDLEVILSALFDINNVEILLHIRT